MQFLCQGSPPITEQAEQSMDLHSATPVHLDVLAETCLQWWFCKLIHRASALQTVVGEGWCDGDNLQSLHKVH